MSENVLLQPIEQGIDWLPGEGSFNSRPAVGDIIRWYEIGGHTEQSIASAQARFIASHKRNSGVTLETVGGPRIEKAYRGRTRIELTYRIASVDPRWFEPDWSI